MGSEEPGSSCATAGQFGILPPIGIVAGLGEGGRRFSVLSPRSRRKLGPGTLLQGLWIDFWIGSASIRYTWGMANPSPLPNQDPGSDARVDQVWLTAGEAADAANVTHQQVAAWVAGRTLSARMGWRGGAEIQLVLLSDLETLVERIDLDRVRGSLAERGVFTGPRRVVLGGFKDASTGKVVETEAADGSKVVVRAAHEVRAEDRVWASELDGEVRRLRQVIRTLRDDHESLERHLDLAPSDAPLASASSAGASSLETATAEPSSSETASTEPSSTETASTETSSTESQDLHGAAAPSSRRSLPAEVPSKGLSSGAMLAITCGVVLGMIGAAIVFPGAKTMASEKRGALADSNAGLNVETLTAGTLETAAESEPVVTSEAEAELAILALEAMEGSTATAPAVHLDDESATEAPTTLAAPQPSLIASATFGGSFTDPLGATATSATGAFFESFLNPDDDAAPSGITGQYAQEPAMLTAKVPTMGPELPPDLRAMTAGSADSGTPIEASAPLAPGAAATALAEEMLVEPPPMKPRARGVKPNAMGAPERLHVPMALAELDRTLFARRSALLSDCAYTEFVGADPTGDGPSAALVLGPCFGPTREGQSGLIAAPGTHRVGNVACCRHHAFVERMTAAAHDETARFGLRTEAKLALGEGVLPPLFRLRANRSATRFVREETRGWTSAGLDGIAGSANSEEAVHEWKLSDSQPTDGSIRVELVSWIQPVVPFDAAKFASDKSKSKADGMKRFHMTLLVQAAPDGDVLEGFEWLTD